MLACPHYNLIVLGNDPAAIALIEKASLEFARIAWLTEEAGDPLSDGFPTLPWNVDHFVGEFQFAASHRIDLQVNEEWKPLSADQIVIATGSTSKKPQWVPEDRRIILADDRKSLGHVEGSVAIVGMGTSGQAVREELLGQCDQLITIDASPRVARGEFQDSVSRKETAVRGNGVAGIEATDKGLELFMENAEILEADYVVLCVGREGRTRGLNLHKAGLTADDVGRIWCNGDYETWTPGVYAIGSVVGFVHEYSPFESAAETVLDAMLSRERVTVAV